MPPDAVLQTLSRLWSVLESTGMQIAVAGGIALSYWGNPRSTQDVDVVVLSNDSETIARALTAAGFEPDEKEPVQLGLFKLSRWFYEPEAHFIDVEVDLMCSTSDYYGSVLSRAKQVSIAGISTPIAVLSREDLILHKLYAARLIDQADVMNLMEMHWSELDMSYLKEWAGKLDLATALNRAIHGYRESHED